MVKDIWRLKDGGRNQIIHVGLKADYCDYYLREITSEDYSLYFEIAHNDDFNG